MRWRPRIVYDGGAVTLDFTLPQRPPIPATVIGAGGGATSAAGVPEHFVIRRDQLLAVRLRFWEDEWPAVRGWIEWAHDYVAAFDFYPDRDDLTVYSCYLQAPGVLDPARPERGEPGDLYELDVTLRTTNGAAWDVRYFG